MATLDSTEERTLHTIAARSEQTRDVLEESRRELTELDERLRANRLAFERAQTRGRRRRTRSPLARMLRLPLWH